MELTDEKPDADVPFRLVKPVPIKFTVPIQYGDQIFALIERDLAAIVGQLHTICMQKDPHFARQETRFALDLCIEAAKEGTKSPEHFKLAANYISKMLFIYDKLPEAIGTLIKNPEKKFELIDHIFKMHLNNLNHAFAAKYAALLLTEAEKFDYTVRTDFPLFFAQLLVTSSGYINIDISRDLIKTFFTEGSATYRDRLVEVLGELSKTPKLRAFIQSIKAPTISTARSLEWIRIMLRLPPDKPVTNASAIQIALSVLCSHPRQEDMQGSCFSMFVLIPLLNGDLVQSCKDLKELIEKSSVSRMVDGQLRVFHPMMRMAFNPEQTIQVAPSGQIFNESSDTLTHLHLWEHSGIYAACVALGIPEDSIPEMIMKAGAVLNNKNPAPKDSKAMQFNVSRLLKTLASIIASKLPKDVRKETRLKLYETVLCAYASETRNLLLSLWENSIAGMSEARETGHLKQIAVSGMTQALKEGIDTFTHIHPKVRSIFLERLTKMLHQRLQYLYDPDLGGEKLKVRSGGFVMFNGDSSKPFQEWVQIRNEDDYIKFACELLPRCAAESGFGESDLKLLGEYVITGRFVDRCIALHDDEYCTLAYVGHQSQYGRSTPWLTFGGNLGDAVIDIYHEKGKTKHSLPAGTPLKICLNLIDFARQLPPEVKVAMAKNPKEMIKACYPEHGFNLTLGHPSFARSWQTEMSVEAWLKQEVMRPGIEIALSQITPDVAKALIEWIRSNFIPELHQQTFLKMAFSLDPNLSYKDFRNQLMEVINRIPVGSLKYQPPMIMQGIDIFFCNALPPELMAKHLKTRTVFADTNYHVGASSDVLMAFFVNPGTGDIGLWRVDTKGGVIEQVEQSAIATKEWHIWI